LDEIGGSPEPCDGVTVIVTIGGASWGVGVGLCCVVGFCGGGLFWGWGCRDVDVIGEVVEVEVTKYDGMVSNQSIKLTDRGQGDVSWWTR
jgi:hypothetical protein